METPDLTKIRRLSLVASIVLITLILAKVKLSTPAIISPLGIPLMITKPDVLYVGLSLVSIFSTLRYIYYGMIIKASPMQARKLLLSGKLVNARTYGASLNDFINDVKQEVSRYFPPYGNHKVEIHIPKQSENTKELKFTLSIPRKVKYINMFEHIDFLFPLICCSCALLSYIGNFFF